MLCYVMFHHIILNYIIVYYTMLYYIMLYHSISYCILLYDILFNYNIFDMIVDNNERWIDIYIYIERERESLANNGVDIMNLIE